MTLLGLVVLVLLVGCGVEAPRVDAGAVLCAGHVKVPCVCDGGAVGLEVCARDGARSCVCP